MERALNQVGKLKGAAERAVTHHAVLHVAGNLDAQEGAFLCGFEFENRPWRSFKVKLRGGDRADSIDRPARRKLAVLLGMAMPPTFLRFSVCGRAARVRAKSRSKPGATFLGRRRGRISAFPNEFWLPVRARFLA